MKKIVSPRQGIKSSLISIAYCINSMVFCCLKILITTELIDFFIFGRLHICHAMFLGNFIF